MLGAGPGSRDGAEQHRVGGGLRHPHVNRLALVVQQAVQDAAAHPDQAVERAAARQAKRPPGPHLDADLDAGSIERAGDHVDQIGPAGASRRRPERPPRARGAGERGGRCAGAAARASRRRR